MSEANLAEQIVKILDSILKISGTEADKKKLSYENKLSEVYKSAIVEPLKKLKELPDVDPKDSITINEKNEISISDKTLVMRKELANLLNPSQDEEPLSDNKRNCIAKWIVEVWGGIPSGKKADDTPGDMPPNKNKGDESLFKCISLADKADKAAEKGGAAIFHFNRVASWSKYLAFKKPGKYAIYDARVIYSLNWLLYQAGAKQYFPFLSGRNAVMGLLDYQIYLFLGKNGSHAESVEKALKDDIEKRRLKSIEQIDSKSTNNSYFSSRLIRHRNLFVHNGDAFIKYCDLLAEIANKLFLEDVDRLTKTEMLLFSVADTVIAEAVLNYISVLAKGKASEE